MSIAPDHANKATWLLRVLSVQVAGADAAKAGGTEDIPGLSAWQTARAAAVQSLQQLEAAFAAMKEPEAPKAICAFLILNF